MSRNLTAPTRRLFAMSVGTYVLLLVLFSGDALWLNGGRLEYLLDDAYIHLSMARHLLGSGTYGVVAGTYQSASSSPAWTLLLAGLGAGNPLALQAIPLVLNVAFSVLLLFAFWVSQEDLRLGEGPAPLPLRFLAALLPVFLLLPSLTMVGMEAVAQSLTVVLMLWLLVRMLSGGGRKFERVVLLVLTAVAVMVRLEDMFVAAGCMVAVSLFGAREFPRLAERARYVALIGLAAVGAFAAIAAGNLSQGQSWLPNSILAKTALIGHTGLPFASITGALSLLAHDPLLCVVLAGLAGYLVFAVLTRRPSVAQPAAVAILCAATLHALLAAVGWYDRYEEYLVVAGTWVVVRFAAEARFGRPRTLAVAAVLVVAALASPTKLVLTIYTATASNNIYLQQHQMGRFLARYYDGRGVVVNDLGEVSFQHRGPLVDLFGLGTYRVLQARRAGTFDRSFVDAEARRAAAPVAVIYSDYWREQIPRHWVLVASWRIDHSAGNLGGSQVDFWATSPASVSELRSNLRRFERELPHGESLEDETGTRPFPPGKVGL